MPFGKARLRWPRSRRATCLPSRVWIFRPNIVRHEFKAGRIAGTLRMTDGPVADRYGDCAVCGAAHRVSRSALRK